MPLYEADVFPPSSGNITYLHRSARLPGIGAAPRGATRARCCYRRPRAVAIFISSAVYSAASLG